jgi:rfaE bifunctional protein kinase chain/domain
MTIDFFLNRACQQQILVIGDVMLDRYIYGKVERISPEAPVPVVEVINEEARPGGAANVAMNLQAFNLIPLLAGVIGTDKDGETLKNILTQLAISTVGLVADQQRRTTAKIRVLANHQQILRIDREDRFELNAAVRTKLVQTLQQMITSKPAAIIFEDYDKGTLDKQLIDFITDTALELKIPVLVDPKKQHFFDYHHAYIFKPNLKELKAGLHLDFSVDKLNDLETCLIQFCRRQSHQHCLVTLGDKGMLLVSIDGESVYYPAHVRAVADVSGAGDTVISTLAVAISVGLPIARAVQLANLAGGLVCELPGVVPVPITKLMHEALHLGIFS